MIMRLLNFMKDDFIVSTSEIKTNSIEIPKPINKFNRPVGTEYRGEEIVQ